MKKLLLLIFFLPALAQAKKIYLKQGYQNGAEITKSQAPTFAAYDTIILKGTYTAIDIEGLWGASASKPIVITAEGPVLISTRLNLFNCGNFKVDGLNFTIKIEGHPYLRMTGGHGVDVYGNCKNFEITGLYIHNKTTGIHITSPVYCPNQDSLNRKGGGGQTGIYIHDNKIVGAFYEGMYISTTSPMNHNNDPRIPDGCSDYRPEPARAKDVRVLHNIVDSSGRPGILFGAVDGVAEIGWNTVTNSGYNGNDAQGPNITTGTFTHAWIHDNVCDNAFTNNIAVFGAALIENNKLSRDFSLATPPYSAIEGADIGSYDVNKIPTVPNNAAALYGNQTSAIYISTRPSVFADPIRHETRGYMDSSSFQLANNTIAAPKKWGAWIEDGYKMMKQVGNCVFNTPNVGAESQIKYSKTACSVAPIPAPNKIPVAFAGKDTTIQEGTFTRTGQGIDSDGRVVSYYWEYTSGTDLGHSSLQTLSAELTSGTYQMTLYVTDDRGAVGQDVLIVTVLPPKPVEKTVFHAGYFNLNGKRFYYIMYNDGTWVAGKK